MGSGSWLNAVNSLRHPGVQPDLLGFLCWVRTLCHRVSSTRGGISVAARRPSGRDFSAHARHCMGVHCLLRRHHGFELEILLYHPYRLLHGDYGVLDCGSMAFGEANLKPLVRVCSSLVREPHRTHRCRVTPSLALSRVCLSKVEQAGVILPNCSRVQIFQQCYP